MLSKLHILSFILLFIACSPYAVPKHTDVKKQDSHNLTAQEILGNPDYPAISFGGYRSTSRDQQPSIEELKEDLTILSAMGVKVVRTYNVSYDHASNVLKAIDLLGKEHPNFEMYLMLGAWIDCENAWTNQPNHNSESQVHNQAEIDQAVALAKQYPKIVKIIAVGNEAMVKWATSYFVQADVILKYVNYLQKLKNSGELDPNIWITSSDNFASWGGGDQVYHSTALNELIKAVDYVSMHTYPMHDTHYNPKFWGTNQSEANLSKEQKIDLAMNRAVQYAQQQFNQVEKYVHSISPQKPIHIGETGWATSSNGFYGNDGSKATDEYKEALYYHKMRNWTNEQKISCFYFEAFDEIWKDAENQAGSENHFGLFDIHGNAKFALWDLVDKGNFKGLTRGGSSIGKTFDGDSSKLWRTVSLPPIKKNR